MKHDFAVLAWRCRKMQAGAWAGFVLRAKSSFLPFQQQTASQCQALRPGECEGKA